MNKGFTKLEIILVGIVLLFTVGFLGTKNLSLFVNKENLLSQRFNKFVSLLDGKNYSEAYNYYSSSIKNKGSLEDYIKGAKEFPNIGKQKVTINNIVIKDNVGYIDRNNTVCEDNNCNTIRGYKRWVFENGNWYYSPPDPLCIRDKPYEKPPEFDRALSLIKQRINTFETKRGRSEIDFSYFNCLDIQYSDLPDAEGVFYFDEGNANIDRLLIKVDNSYKENDDVLTAILIDHELMHAYQYIQKAIENKGSTESCVDKEISAYISQIVFIGTFNSEELNSINRRLSAGYNNLNSSLKMVWDLITFENKANRYCKESDCYFNLLRNDIGKMIESNPYYQKQCGQN